MTVCFDFPSANAHDNNGVGERVADGGVMPAVKSDFGPHENRLQVLCCYFLLLNGPPFNEEVDSVLNHREPLNAEKRD